MQYSTKLLSLTKKFYLRLRAMPSSVKFKPKIFLPTPCYAAQRGVDSALCRISGSLCRIVQGCDSLLCRIAQSCDSVLCGVVRS
jgi:hypothetical protein